MTLERGSELEHVPVRIGHVRVGQSGRVLTALEQATASAFTGMDRCIERFAVREREADVARVAPTLRTRVERDDTRTVREPEKDQLVDTEGLLRIERALVETEGTVEVAHVDVHVVEADYAGHEGEFTPHPFRMKISGAITSRWVCEVPS